MTTPESQDPWTTVLALFNQGDTPGGFALLALWCDRMASLAHSDEGRRRLARMRQASATLAQEWFTMLQLTRQRLQRLLADDQPAAWVKCPDCDGYFCTIHLTHVHDCTCPPIDDWDVDPYVEGRRLVEQQVEEEAQRAVAEGEAALHPREQGW